MIKRILAALLAVLMIIPMALVVFAEETTEEVTRVDYTTAVWKSKAQRLAAMKLAGISPNGNLMLYIDEGSGEMGVKNVLTGEIVLTNPYDIVDSNLPSREKPYLLSQIDLNFTTISSGESRTLHSYSDCLSVGQATFSYTSNSVTVNYVLGRQEKKILVPNKIKLEDFEALLEMVKDGIYKSMLAEELAKVGNENLTEEEVAPLIEGKVLELYNSYRTKILGSYVLYGPESEEHGISQGKAEQAVKEYPISATQFIYVIRSSVSSAGKELIEGYFKSYTGLSNADLEKYIDDAYALVEEKGIDDFSVDQPPSFKVTATYEITNSGLVATVDASSIDYDKTKYIVNTISILPYFNAAHASYKLPAGGSNKIDSCDTGYTFIPDGSGALVRFEDLYADNNRQVKFENTMYGNDYAYYQIKTKNAANMTMPVFGLANTSQKNGFFAVIEDGDALAIVTSNHSSAYHSIYATFKLTPSDVYDLADSFSSGSTSSKKIGINAEKLYRGNCQVSYTLLTDDSVAAEHGITEYYANTYVGMAKCYREYLQANGTISKITDDRINKDYVKLFLETFGSIQVEEKIATFPVTVNKELTTFEDIEKIYAELKSKGVGNMAYILKGFANGGLLSEYPTYIEWQDVLGGDDGFNDLLKYADKNGFQVYPDIEFSYAYGSSTFSEYSHDEHGVRTLDNRYTTKRVYYAATQTFERTGGVAVSAASFEYMYEIFYEAISEYDVKYLSVRSLGSDLNSDFDAENYYDREGSKDKVVAMLKLLKGASGNDPFDLLIDAGNSYAMPYASSVLAVSLDSSRRSEMSESVPFYGMVFHASVEFAGDAFNMEGDTDYAFLKAIENGATLYFTVAKNNVELLKFDPEYNKYYSVSYDNLKDDIIATYKKYNAAMKDVQNKYIVDHGFLNAECTADGTAVDSSLVVMVEYEGGIGFVLNYSSYEINVTMPNGEAVTIAPFGFEKYQR